MAGTSTFTSTHAEYLASKVASDLLQMQRLYGQPSSSDIANYQQEIVLLLKEGYLNSIDYGFKKNDSWVLALSYEANNITGTLIDNNPGRIPIGVDISGASWGSYLRKNIKFELLQQTEKDALDARIIIKRSGASDPQIGTYGMYDKIYGANDQQLNRKIIK